MDKIRYHKASSRFPSFFLNQKISFQDSSNLECTLQVVSKHVRTRIKFLNHMLINLRNHFKIQIPTKPYKIKEFNNLSTTQQVLASNSIKSIHITNKIMIKTIINSSIRAIIKNLCIKRHKCTLGNKNSFRMVKSISTNKIFKTVLIPTNTQSFMMMKTQSLSAMKKSTLQSKSSAIPTFLNPTNSQNTEILTLMQNLTFTKKYNTRQEMESKFKITSL